jgi:hypothetical protein
MASTFSLKSARGPPPGCLEVLQAFCDFTRAVFTSLKATSGDHRARGRHRLGRALNGRSPCSLVVDRIPNRTHLHHLMCSIEIRRSVRLAIRQRCLSDHIWEGRGKVRHHRFLMSRHQPLPVCGCSSELQQRLFGDDGRRGRQQWRPALPTAGDLPRPSNLGQTLTLIVLILGMLLVGLAVLVRGTG